MHLEKSLRKNAFSTLIGAYLISMIATITGLLFIS
jgi:hypothetical protein